MTDPLDELERMVKVDTAKGEKALSFTEWGRLRDDLADLMESHARVLLARLRAAEAVCQWATRNYGGIPRVARDALAGWIATKGATPSPDEGSRPTPTQGGQMKQWIVTVGGSLPGSRDVITVEAEAVDLGDWVQFFVADELVAALPKACVIAIRRVGS